MNQEETIKKFFIATTTKVLESWLAGADDIISSFIYSQKLNDDKTTRSSSSFTNMLIDQIGQSINSFKSSLILLKNLYNSLTEEFGFTTNKISPTNEDMKTLDALLIKISSRVRSFSKIIRMKKKDASNDLSSLKVLKMLEDINRYDLLDVITEVDDVEHGSKKSRWASLVHDEFVYEKLTEEQKDFLGHLNRTLLGTERTVREELKSLNASLSKRLADERGGIGYLSDFEIEVLFEFYGEGPDEDDEDIAQITIDGKNGYDIDNLTSNRFRFDVGLIIRDKDKPHSYLLHLLLNKLGFDKIISVCNIKYMWIDIRPWLQHRIQIKKDDSIAKT